MAPSASGGWPRSFANGSAPAATHRAPQCRPRMASAACTAQGVTSTNGATNEPVQARSALLDAINAEGDIWTANKALALLESRGWRTESGRPVNLVGNLLGAMARDGDLVRAGRGECTSLQPATPNL